MKFLVILAAAAVSSIISMPHDASAQNSVDAQETAFFLQIEDMPLMPGLTELTDETISYDKPEGRIIESYAIMEDISRAQVTLYYKATLPQFGWGAVKENVFFRGREYLELSFVERAGKSFLRVMVKPTL